jgi:cell division protein FtsL
MEVNERMTANWAGTVVNTLLLAFFVVCALGVVVGVYAARALKKVEQYMPKKEE